MTSLVTDRCDGNIPVCVCVRVLTESYQFSVLESEPVPAVVAKIRAVDLDVGPNAEMDYCILDGDGPGTFSIITDPNTQEGLVTLNKVRESTLLLFLVEDAPFNRQTVCRR